MNVEDLIKDNPEMSSKKLEIISKRQIGVALDYFVLKQQRQAINENFEETLRNQHKRLTKNKRGKDNDEQEGGPTFMINASAAVQEV